MKTILILLTVCVLGVFSQVPCEQKAKELAAFINGFSGTLPDLKVALKARMAEEKKNEKKPTPEEITKFIDMLCAEWKSTLWTCDDFKKWSMEEMPKL